MDLFELASENERQKAKPLAERMRPIKLSEFYGQEHIVGENALLHRAISIDRLGSCIFYGNAGCGKTSLAGIISNMTNSECIILNAVSTGSSEAKKLMEEAKIRYQTYGRRTYLILDECHRWNKAQSDSLLAPIEQGYIVFIGTTTENPYISLTKALLSRCRIFEFKKLTASDIKVALEKAIIDPRGLLNYNVEASEEALWHIANYSDGDLRTAYNALEIAVLTTDSNKQGKIILTKEIAASSTGGKSLSIDESSYYDMLSAFCKSLRGSDADAAVYWAIRMLEGGVDPLIIFRRLIVHSSEDVGMADPMALHIATSSMIAFEKIGMPEGRIPLCQAIIYVAEASKSNSVVEAIAVAEELVKNVKDDTVPKHLQDKNYKIDKVEGYKYPHSYGGYVEQQYLPDSIKNISIYKPSKNGFEGKLVRAKTINKNKG